MHETALEDVSALGCIKVQWIMGVQFNLLGSWECTSVHLDYGRALECTSVYLDLGSAL